MALNKLSTDTINEQKKEFVEGTGPKAREIKTPVRRGYKLSDDKLDYFKLMVFGQPGAGKTHLIGQFVRDLGMRVILVTTDIGDSGHLTIRSMLTKAGKQELMDNVYVLPLAGWYEVQQFLRDPWKFDPELANFNPDIIAWDGFSGFQQIDLTEYVGDLTTDKDRGDYRESGLMLEQRDWNVIKTGTVRTIDKFMSIKRLDEKPVHKIVTCHEAVSYKPLDASKPNSPQQVVDSYRPLLQGQGGVLSLGASDLILRAAIKSRRTGNTATTEYVLITSGHENVVAKSRGVELEPEIPNSAVYLWERIQKALGIGVEKISSSGA